MMSQSHAFEQPHQRYINKFQHPQQLTPDQIHLNYEQNNYQMLKGQTYEQVGRNG